MKRSASSAAMVPSPIARGDLAVSLGADVSHGEHAGKGGPHVFIGADIALFHIDEPFKESGIRFLAYEAEHAVHGFLGGGPRCGILERGAAASVRSGFSAVMVVFTLALMMPVARARSCVDCAAAQAGNISTIWMERTPRPARYRDSSNPLFPPPTTSTSLSL